MDITAVSVAASPNLIGGMDAGINKHLGQNIWNANIFVFSLETFNFFTILFKNAL